MTITLKQIALIKRKHPQWNEAFNHLLMVGLSKQRKYILQLVRDGVKTTSAIAKRCGVSVYHASYVLKQLYDLTLIGREVVLNQNGKHFIYTVKD
jgi:predicted transcriptional regulator